MVGPLQGIRVVELAAIGPVPHCGMHLADLGADVIRVDRVDDVGRIGGQTGSMPPVFGRGKRSIAVDLKHSDGVEVVLRLAAGADALIEGFRPGVTERLGIGPASALARNSSLVYGRMTGWGQAGPLASTAGHDIDYIAVAGALYPIGSVDKPYPPLNLVGDFGGGAMLLAVGILAGIIRARADGTGQVVDAAMLDGAAHLTTMIHGALAEGWWSPRRHSNLLDGGAPFYDTYETADGGHVAVGALEPQFYAELLARLELEDEDLPPQYDRQGWPRIRRRFAELFRTRSRDEWVEVFAGSDACVAPVLSLVEAPHHPQAVARNTFLDIDGVVQPAPAPRFEATPNAVPGDPCRPGQHSVSILEELGFDRGATGRILANHAVRQDGE